MHEHLQRRGAVPLAQEAIFGFGTLGLGPRRISQAAIEQA